ncbi:hypothetical protein B0H21DRAFT_726944 [Amylocystis lapponica]|nr:hypothetical protein B0H21DRAFT_726944 [Amylocystis lapponica]
MPSSSLETIFGAALVGIVLAAVVYGIFCCQVYTYFGKYPRDKLWMKGLVLGLWIVLSLQVATNIHGIYVYLIADFGELNKLQSVTWDWLLYIIYTSVVSTAVQMFFARRVFLLTPHLVLRWVLTGVIVTLSLVQLAFGIVVMAECYKFKIFLDFTKISWGADVWLGCSSACDILIAVSMCFFLSSYRTGIRRTDKLINMLMAYAIQTGAVTSITEIICLATFTVGGYHFGHVLVIYPIAGLYTTSLLANLHSRQSNSPDASMNVIEFSSQSGGRTLPSTGMRVERTIKFAPSTSTTVPYLEHDPGTRQSMEKPIDSNVLNITLPEGPAHSASTSLAEGAV